MCLLRRRRQPYSLEIVGTELRPVSLLPDLLCRFRMPRRGTREPRYFTSSTRMSWRHHSSSATVLLTVVLFIVHAPKNDFEPALDPQPDELSQEPSPIGNAIASPYGENIWTASLGLQSCLIAPSQSPQQTLQLPQNHPTYMLFVVQFIQYPSTWLALGFTN